MPGPSRPPTARLRRLASELLALRNESGLSRDDVQESTGINAATLYRIEMAKARPQPRTLKALLDLYGASDEKREGLSTLLRDAGQQTWLQPYQEDLPPEYNTLISFEAEAQQVWTYGMTIIPGLLQAEGYARHLIAGMLPDASDQEVERRVETRMRRQEVLSKKNPLKLWAIVDEAALRRPAGSSDDMRAQVDHLRKAMQRPEVTLQILPFDAGPHPAMLGAFDILKFAEAGLSDIIYLEGLTNDLFLDDAVSAQRYAETFDYLRAGAASPVQTDSFLARVAESL